MKLFISDIKYAKESLNNFDYVISILDEDTIFPSLDKKKHLKLFVNDITYSNDTELLSTLVETVVDWSQRIPEDAKVLVHCHMGISRSPATAIVLLLSKGYTIDQAINCVFDIRPFAFPNKIIIKTTDDYFKLNGELILKINNK
mgnify:FL=1